MGLGDKQSVMSCRRAQTMPFQNSIQGFDQKWTVRPVELDRRRFLASASIVHQGHTTVPNQQGPFGNFIRPRNRLFPAQLPRGGGVADQHEFNFVLSISQSTDETDLAAIHKNDRQSARSFLLCTNKKQGLVRVIWCGWRIFFIFFTNK